MGKNRLIAAFLLPAGIVTGHALCFAATDALRHSWQSPLVAHGAYPAVAAVALLVAFATASWVAWTSSPDAWRLPRMRLLAPAQVAAFLAAEAITRLALGYEPVALVHEPALWLAVASQLLALVVWLSLVHTVRYAVGGLRVRAVSVTRLAETPVVPPARTSRLVPLAGPIGVPRLRAPPLA